MLLSVYMPHSGHDEEDCILALTDQKAGATDFIIGGPSY